MKYRILAILLCLFAGSSAVAQVSSERLGRFLLREHFRFNDQNQPVTFDYGPQGHAGIDFRARNPLPVYSPVSGVVSESDEGNGHFAIRMENGTFFIFLHLSEIYIEDGEVAVGDMIGLTGGTLYNNFPISGPHLHVEARTRSGNPADPNNPISYASNVNPTTVVNEPERVRYAYTLAPLVESVDVRFNQDGNLVFDIGVSSYSDIGDLNFLVNIYEDGNSIYQGSFNEDSAEVSVADDAGGFVTVTGDNRLGQNLVSINGATNQVQPSSVVGELSMRVFIRNNSVCSAFDLSTDNCTYTSAFIANIGGDNLGRANFLREGDTRRVYVDPSVVY